MTELLNFKAVAYLSVVHFDKMAFTILTDIDVTPSLSQSHEDVDSVKNRRVIDKIPNSTYNWSKPRVDAREILFHTLTDLQN